MKQLIREFDTSQKDTCMNRWVFRLQRAEGDTTPVIESLEIERTSQGCPGHPKTISALVKGRPIDQMDLEALAATECFRGESCGQVFGQCVAAIKEG